MESEVDLDLLFITYDGNRISEADLIEMVGRHGFEAVVRDTTNPNESSS